MQADTRAKICPKCGSHNLVTVRVCQCGHQFRTNFTASPTVTVPQQPAVAPAPIPTAVVNSFAYAHLKTFEWKVKVAWCWFGAMGGLAAFIEYPTRMTSEFDRVDAAMMLSFLGIASACAVGLSRLYPRVLWDGFRKTLAITGVVAVIAVGASVYRTETLKRTPPVTAGISRSDAKNLIKLDMYDMEVRFKLGPPVMNVHDGFEGGVEHWYYRLSDGPFKVTMIGNRVMSFGEVTEDQIPKPDQEVPRGDDPTK